MSGTVNTKKLRQPAGLLLLHAMPESRFHKLPPVKTLEFWLFKKINPRKKQTLGSSHAHVALLFHSRHIKNPMTPAHASPNNHSFQRTPAIEREGANLQISDSRTAVPITADIV
jgi:hypothetical protein